MANMRSIYLDPSGVGSKEQFAVSGAATDWQALAKATRQPSTPSSTSFIQSSSGGDQENITYPAIGGSLNAGEYINFLRVWTYINGVMPAFHNIDLTLQAAGSSLTGSLNIPTGSSGWVSTAKLSPWLDLAPLSGLPRMITTADTFQASMKLNETSTQAAFTQITAQYIEVGVSTMDHTIVQPVFFQDRFATDTIAGGGWTHETGSGTLGVSGGLLVPSDTSEKRILKTDDKFGDGRISLYGDPTATTTNTRMGFMIKHIDDQNYIRAYARTNGLIIEKVVNGGISTLATNPLPNLADQDFRLRVRTDGNWITLEYFSGFVGAGLQEHTTPTQVVRYQLTGSDATKFGLGVSADWGIYWVPQSTSERIGEVTKIARGRKLVGMSDWNREYKNFSYAQYGSVVFDDWMTTDPSTFSVGVTPLLETMRNYKKDFIRIFMGFGQQMADFSAVARADLPTTHLRMDATSGTSEPDGMGNPFVPGNVGTYVNTPLLGDAGLLTGDTSTAVTFRSAQSEEMTISAGPALTTNCAIEFIIDDWTAGTAIGRDHTSGGGWILGYDASGFYKVRIGGTDISTSAATSQVRDGNKHHFVINKTGANAEVWMDGLLIGSTTSATNTAAALPWHLARNGSSGTYSDIKIDELLFYPAALTPAQIARHYAAVNTSPWLNVNEKAWQNFELFLEECVKADIRIDVTGLTMFGGPGSGQAPNWLDANLTTPALRWAAFGRWWKRAAQAVAGSPAVIMLDLVNEPMAPDDSPGDWWIGSQIFYYGTYLTDVRDTLGDIGASEVFLNFFRDMRAQIRQWEPIKPLAMADHGTVPGGTVPDNEVAPGVLAAMSDILTPHMYLKTNIALPSTWYRHIRDTLTPLNRPIISEEGGTVDVQHRIPEYSAYAARMQVQGYSIAMQNGWRNALFAYDNDLGTAQHKTITPSVHLKRPRDRRIGRPLLQRVGERHI